MVDLLFSAFAAGNPKSGLGTSLAGEGLDAGTVLETKIRFAKVNDSKWLQASMLKNVLKINKARISALLHVLTAKLGQVWDYSVAKCPQSLGNLVLVQTPGEISGFSEKCSFHSGNRPPPISFSH